MADFKKESFSDILNLIKKEDGGEGVTLITRNGLVVDSKLAQDIDTKIFGVMLTTMMGTSESAITELKKGQVRRIIAESDEIKLIIMYVGPNAILATIVKPSADIDSILAAMENAADKIKNQEEN